MKDYLASLAVMVVTNLIVTAFGGPAWAAFGFGFLAYLTVKGQWR